MSYCLNPKCSHPENLTKTSCQSCGAHLLLRSLSRHQSFGKEASDHFFRDESAGESNCVVKQLRLVNTAQVLQMARELFARNQNPRKISSHPTTAAGLL